MNRYTVQGWTKEGQFIDRVVLASDYDYLLRELSREVVWDLGKRLEVRRVEPRDRHARVFPRMG